MNGILVVDKPSGPTSHDICQYFKRTLPVCKVGHAGTLDPLATGVLVILLDGATKLSSTFMGGDKEYQFTMRLGVSTDTYDSEGKVMDVKPIPDGTLEKLKPLLKDFTGTILQIPPPFSAIKKNGVPLYKLARAGKEAVAAPRKIRIDFLEVSDPWTGHLSAPCQGISAGGPTLDVTLRVRCSCGTYVRSLAHDLGQRLGVGAHITALRRLRSEPFGIEDSISLTDFSRV